MKKMKNRAGFTLTELLVTLGILALITGIGLLVTVNVRDNILEKQYQNVKKEIEIAAEEYANNTSIITVSVAKLIEEGYLLPDDETDIYNPINHESLNCKIVETTIEDGNYVSTLTENGTYDSETNTCSDYEVKIDSLIDVACYSETNDPDELAKCEKSLEKTENAWYSGSVILTAKGVEGKEIESYRWSSLVGDSSSESSMVVTTSSVKTTVYTLSVTYTDGTIAEGRLQVQIDNEAPTILNINKNEEWTNVAKDVVIDATDGSFSGLDSYRVVSADNSYDSGYQESNTFSLEMGTYYAYAQDKSGNISEPVEFIVDRIDKTKPVAQMTGDGYFETESSTMGITYYSELTRKITFVDKESMMDKIKYCYTDEEECTPTSEENIEYGSTSTALLSYPAAKNAQRVCVVGIDVAGNESDVYCDDTFLVDTTKPIDVNAENKNNSSIIDISANDPESGINKYVCRFGTSSNNLNNSVTVTTSDTSATCNLGSLTSQKNYFVQVDAYNNANLVSSSDIISFKAVVTVEDAFTNTCGNGEYCSKGLYVNYNNYLFILYRETSQGYKAVYNSSMGPFNFLQSSCCNNGNCTYGGARYINGELSRYLNGTFINNLPYYTTKLSRATWYTGPKTSVTSRSDTAYVGLMDYNEYLATRSYSFLYSGANNVEHWLLNPATTSSYVNNVTIRYSNGQFYESSQVVNTGASARPVIVLKGNVEFTSGDGTINNPYRVL